MLSVGHVHSTPSSADDSSGELPRRQPLGAARSQHATVDGEAVRAHLRQLAQHAEGLAAADAYDRAPGRDVVATKHVPSGRLWHEEHPDECEQRRD
eukprot:488458-Prymnesium_polylepis.1